MVCLEMARGPRHLKLSPPLTDNIWYVSRTYHLVHVTPPQTSGSYTDLELLNLCVATYVHCYEVMHACVYHQVSFCIIKGLHAF